MKKILFCGLILLQGALSFSGKAQVSSEAQVRYQNAQELLKQQKPALAMAEFLPLTNLSQPNQFQASASFLYSVAANKAGKNKEASAMLEQLVQNFPGWENIEEAYYLKAKIAFEQNDFPKALTALNNVSSEFILADATAMKRSFLTIQNDKNQFLYLLKQFPEDAELNRIYAGKLVTGWYTPEDKSTLENIVRKFNLDATLYNPATIAASQKKAHYNVAVLLPLALKDVSQARKNQFITDLYAGMKLAQDSLARNNVKINLFAYNSGSDTVTTKSVLQLPELKTMDLVIGPVYKSTSRVASAFAAQHKINLINPLSDDLSLVKGNPHVFLFESSVETRARKAADYAFDTFEPKTAALIFENTRDDTLFARIYRQQFIARGGEVLLYKKINTKKNPNVMLVYNGVDLTKYGHIMVASSNLPAAVATISQLESQNPKLPVLTYDEWLEMPQLSLQQLDELEFHFIYPKFIDNSSTTVKSFRRNYLVNNKIPPTAYAYNGFEMLYYFGNLLHQSGPQFQTVLPNTGVVSGVFYPGIGYSNSQDNQYVPVFKLDNQSLNLMNPVIR